MAIQKTSFSTKCSSSDRTQDTMMHSVTLALLSISRESLRLAFYCETIQNAWPRSSMIIEYTQWVLNEYLWSDRSLLYNPLLHFFDHHDFLKLFLTNCLHTSMLCKLWLRMVCMNGLFEIGQISKYLKPFKFISKGCKVYNVKLVGDHREKLTKAVWSLPCDIINSLSVSHCQTHYSCISLEL